jgi:hypothetical protein
VCTLMPAKDWQQIRSTYSVGVHLLRLLLCLCRAPHHEMAIAYKHTKKGWGIHWFIFTDNAVLKIIL